MSTADVSGSPHRPAKASAPDASAAPEPVAPDPSLSPAAESSDPAVHQLLAERQTAAQNGDEAAALRVTGALAALGYR